MGERVDHNRTQTVFCDDSMGCSELKCTVLVSSGKHALKRSALEVAERCDMHFKQRADDRRFGAILTKSNASKH
jgi:hypothetical protein